MQFELRTDSDRPLRPIPLIPDFAACLIEGQNGAGKSLAIRLLQLATGDQPYGATPRAWESLRDGLDDVHIVASKLEGADRIEWLLRPTDWPLTPEAVGDWIGEIRIDGALSDLSAVRRLLRVHRVAGDETLGQAIALRIREDHTLIRRARPKVEERAARLDDQFHATIELIEAMDAPAVVGTVEELDVIRTRLHELLARLPAVQERFATLDRAHRNQQALAALEADGPELERQIAQQTERVEAAEASVSTLEARQEELGARIAKADALGEQIEHGESELRRRVKAANKAREKAAEKAAQLSVGAEADAVRDAHQAAGAERDQIAQRLARLDVAPRLGEVSTAVRDELAGAVSGGLGEAPIARLEDDRVLSINEVTGAVVRESEHRGRDEDDALISELKAEHEAVESRVSSLWSLRQSIAYADAASKRAADQAATLDALRQRLEPDAANEYRELSEKLAAARDAYLTAVLRRTDLIGQLQRLGDGRTPDDILRDLNSDLAAAGVEGHELEARWTAITLEHDALTAETEALAGQQSALDQRLSEQMATARAAGRRLLADPASAWMRSAGLDLPGPGMQLDPNLIAKVGSLASIIEAARNLLERAVSRVRALEPTLDALGSAVARNDPDALRPTGVGQALNDHLLTLYGDEFTARLAGPEVASALFEGGKFLRLDLRNLSVMWQTAQGTVTGRPLEAFSSGERAFAYTLARLESLAGEPTRNRLIALDEFGAFLARDRLDRLVAFLRQRIIGKIAQQVLIILPLTQDYAGQIESTTGEWHDTVVQRAQLVRDQRYFAESWEAATL